MGSLPKWRRGWLLVAGGWRREVGLTRPEASDSPGHGPMIGYYLFAFGRGGLITASSQCSLMCPFSMRTTS